MNRFEIDRHKLIYHIDRVADWLNKREIYPIYMEISPVGGCNHRCTYCGLDFMEYQPKYLHTDLLKERLSELGRLGLKSIMFAGEGEPFLHPDIAPLINHARKSGIDVGVTTNGVLFRDEVASKVLVDLEWIKIGVDAGCARTYAQIHHCQPEDFDQLIKNMRSAVRIKRDNHYACTLGAQLLLLPENHQEVIPLTELVKDIGMDYLVIKPYSQHPQSKTDIYKSVRYSDYEYLIDKLSAYDGENFSVIFRINTMKKWDRKERTYGHCLALPFWSYIDVSGNVWGCSVYLGDKRFFYGNIYKQSFQEIWESKKRLESLRWVQEQLDVSQCRVNCRMDAINSYLWDLKHPPEHVNFI